MKNHPLQLLGIVALLALPSCATNAQSKKADHALTINMGELKSPPPPAKKALKQTTWEIKEGNQGAFDLDIKTNEIIQWTCTSGKDFSIVVTNRSFWTIVSAKTATWRTDVCPCETGDGMGVIDSSGGVLTLRFTNYVASSGTCAYRIFISPIHGCDDLSKARVQQVIFMWPTGYYDDMAEATISW